MTDFEAKCYGMSEADIRDQYMNSITARISGLEMVVMGILSDAQELVGFSEAGNTVAGKQARQQMNIAKFILAEMQDQKEAV